MHAHLDLRFAFDQASIPGDTLEEKEATLRRTMQVVVEQASKLLGDNAVNTGLLFVDEVFSNVEIKSCT